MKTYWIVVGILVIALGFAGTAQATWCNSSFSKRIDINVNNSGGSALTNYQIFVNLSSNHINESSLRVYNKTDCSLRSYWCENITNGNCTKLWINYSAIAASAWTNDTAIYYDNDGVSSASDGDATFELFDDNFENLTSLIEVFIDQHNATYPRVVYPNIAKMPNGRLLAVYKKNTVSGDNHYAEVWGAFSDDNGASWGTPFQIEAGNSPTWGACEPSLLVVNDSKVLLIYLRWYGTSDSRIYRKVSTDNGTTWGNDTQINTSHNYNCQTKNGIKMQDETLIVPFSWDTGGFVWRCSVLRSTDGGENWTEGGQVPASGIGSNGEDEATVVELSNHSLYMLLRNNGGHLLETKSTDNGDNWTTPVASSLVSPDSNADLFRVSWSPNKILVAWDDSPSNRYPLKIAESTDDCNTWTNEKTIKSPGYAVSYPSIALSSDNHIIVGWWDKPGANDDAKSTRFTEGWLTKSKWNVNLGSPTVGGGILNLSSDDRITSKNTVFTTNRALRVRLKIVAVSEKDCMWGGVTAYTNWDNVAIFRTYEDNQEGGTWTSKNDVDEKQSAWDYTTGSYKTYDVIRNGTASVIFKEDDTTQATHSTQVPTVAQKIILWSSTDDELNVDWIIVREYADPEPSSTLGSEEQQGGTPPLISNVTNGSISSTSQWIDWDVNQTAHNRVLYSNESDLTPAYYSAWDNNTAAPNITLSGLDSNTQYWYQVWSYNTSNTTLSDNSSTLTFTTASSDTSFTVTLPSGYTYLRFEPATSTALSVTPNGQSDSQEFFNVTNTGEVNLDIRLKLNETVSNILLKADTDNTPQGAKEVNTTLVTIYSNLSVDNSVNIWLWSDFDYTPEQDTNKTISINVTQST